MVLIKENLVKKRKVFLLNHCYKKIWYYKDKSWFENHIMLMEKVCPKYILNYGITETSMWIDTKILNGQPASKFNHNINFIETIVNYCKNNYKKTYPYAHGDWVLSNIIIGNEITMCDWDNLNYYPQNEVFIKMRKDLESAFSIDLTEYFNDTTIV